MTRGEGEEALLRSGGAAGGEEEEAWQAERGRYEAEREAYEAEITYWKAEAARLEGAGIEDGVKDVQGAAEARSEERGQPLP